MLTDWKNLSYRFGLIAPLLLVVMQQGRAEETFVTIQRVSGYQMQIAKDAPASEGRGRGMRGDNANAIGRGRGRGFRGTTDSTITVTVPRSAKITSAMRERRTSEFRVLAELPGGLRHPTFRAMTSPLQARIVTKNNTITEINVITGGTDINQSGANREGKLVIAVRPKRPPMKRR